MLALATIKSALGVTGTADDAFLNAQIALVSAAIEARTERKWVRATYTDTWREPRTRSLRVHEPPLHSVTTLTVDGNAITTFAADTELGRVLRGTNGEQSFYTARTVQVQYDGGYNEADLPSWFSEAFKGVMGARYQLKPTQGVVVTEEEATISSVRVEGVGSVGLETSGALGFSASAYDKNFFAGVLGPFVTVFDQYRDYALAHGAGGR